MRTTYYSLITLLYFFISGITALGQSSNQLSYFPHAVGDKWRYRDNISGSLYEVEIVKDSISSDGSIHLFYDTIPVPRYKIDTLKQVYQFRISIDTNNQWHLWQADLWFNLNAVQDDSFYTTYNNDLIRVATFPMNVFGKWTPSKEYKWHPGTSDFWESREVLSEGFGLISSISKAPITDIGLTGCVINGISYGTLVSMDINSNVQPNLPNLYQNYPNPFNGMTRITFNLIQSGLVKLVVYDVLGREIVVLVNCFKSVGMHEVFFKADRICSGIYFYSINTSSYRDTKKMILLK